MGFRRIWQIAWPATLESFFVGLTGLIDTAMVSALGTSAIASVGLTNQPKFICLAFALSLNVGVVALVSRRLGEGELAAGRGEGVTEASKVLRHALTLGLLLSIATCSLTFLAARPFLFFAGAGGDTIDQAVVYLRIVIAGQLFQHMCLTINCAQRCIGLARLSMVTNLCACLVNICFNYLLIGGQMGFPAWGVAGAAAATSLGHLVAFCIALASLLSKRCRFVTFASRDWIPSAATMKSLWHVSIGALGEHMALRAGFLVYVLIVANLGTLAFATHQICMNITNMVISCFDGVSIAAAAVVGLDMGARNPASAERNTLLAGVMSLAGAAVFVVLFAMFPQGVMGIFSKDPDVVRMGAPILVILAAGTFGASVNSTCSGALRGAGDTRFVAVSSLVSTTLIRPALSWFLCYPIGLGLVGPWLGLLIDFWLRAAMNFSRFCAGRWKSIVL
ncbi:MAG: MATE family efflux transporter [Lachnospiraceae bacterium]|nr:MATE family efflux transporter [Lachnospiraceae bacterium]